MSKQVHYGILADFSTDISCDSLLFILANLSNVTTAREPWNHGIALESKRGMGQLLVDPNSVLSREP